MQALLDFLPVVAFVVAYWLTDLRTAIIVIMIAVSLQVAITYALKRTVNRILLISAILVVGLGSLSLFLNNELVFKWKPTVLNWILALAFLVSRFVGTKPLIRRLMDAVTKSGEISLSTDDWQRLNLMWVGFFAISGAANIYVAYRFTEAVWVNFKLFGLLGLTLVFVLIQAVWMGRRQVGQPSDSHQ